MAEKAAADAVVYDTPCEKEFCYSCAQVRETSVGAQPNLVLECGSALEVMSNISDVFWGDAELQPRWQGRRLLTHTHTYSLETVWS